MSKKTMINDLTEGSVFKKMIAFAVPVMISNALQLGYTIADMIIVGQFVGADGLSAVTTAGQIFSLMTTLCIGFTLGAQIYISQLVGMKAHDRLNRTIGTTFTLVGGMGVLMTVLGLLGSKAVLKLMNTPIESFDMAMEYMLICSGGILFAYGYSMVSAVLRGMGDSKRPLLFIAISSIINIVGDLVLVAVLHMGAAGAALATILGQAISFLFALFYLYRKKEEFFFDFKPKSFVLDKVVSSVLLQLGVPFAIQNGSIDISMMFVCGLVNSFGVVASATFGVGCRLQNLGFVMSGAVGSSTGGVVGQNLAAGKEARARKGVHIGLVCNVVFWGVLMVLFLLFPEWFFGLFSNEKEVLEMAPMFMACMAVGIPALSFMSPYNGFIQGLGNSRLSLVFALLDGFVARIGLSYLLGIVANLGLQGFFLGYFIAPYFTTVPTMIYFYSGVWRSRKLYA